MIETMALQTFRKLRSHHILYFHCIYISAAFPRLETQFAAVVFVLSEEVIY